MDVIVEGQITPEEGMDEIIQILVALKTVPTPILRINCFDPRFQGKIGFTLGGYILGARIDETGETGYPAVRQLLSVTKGNYAILDPEKQSVTDLNQGLWIEGTKIIALLPNIPVSPEGLVSVSAAIEGNTINEPPYEQILPGKQSTLEKTPSVARLNSRARQFISHNWHYRFVMASIWAIVFLALSLIIALYSDSLMPYLESFVK